MNKNSQIRLIYGIILGIILIGIFCLYFVIADNHPEQYDANSITRTASTETVCRIIDRRKVCNLVLYSGVRYWQNKSGDWVDPSELFKITRSEDDLTFHYDGIEGYYNVTFETGVIYNGNYYSMQEVKQLYPEIQFDFPTKKYPANWKYAVNITNIPLNKSKIENIT